VLASEYYKAASLAGSTKSKSYALPKGLSGNKDEKESDTQRQIIAYCAAHKIWCQRIEGGAKIVQSKCGPMMIPSAQTGMPDLLCIRNGVVFGVEIKRPSGKLSTPQAIKLCGMQAAGARVGIVCSVDGFASMIEGLGPAATLSTAHGCIACY
jgi:hypothetical protein